MRFAELKKVLQSYGYSVSQPKGGSSQYTYRKPGCKPITIPNHEPIKIVYVRMVKEIVESEEKTGRTDMKTLDEYMKMPYKLEIIPDTEESGYVASYPELPGCITCGKTIADAVANAEDAKKAWLTAAIEDGIEIAEPETVDSYSGQFKLRLPKTLHKTLAEDSKKEGVSMNQYCVYLLAKNSEKEHVALAKKQAVLV